MRLIASTFGLDGSDPYVPPVEFLGSRDDEESWRTFVGWVSELPAAADESVNALALSMRAEATVEHTEFAASVSLPWQVLVETDEDRVTLVVEVSGPMGWHVKLTETGSEALAARAMEISATAWAVWHASGQVYNHEQLVGVLWLTGAGHDWNDALELTAILSGS